MTQLPSFGHQQIVTNLDTYTHTVVSAGLRIAKALVTIPAGSGLTITIQHNGSTIASSPAPVSLQDSIYVASLPVYCAVNDTISWIIASSAAIDQSTNALQITLSTDLTGNLN